MIEQAKIQRITLSGLEKYIGCKCVPTNTTLQMPAYPFVSFNIINITQKKGTYAEAAVEKDGAMVKVLFVPLLLKFSFTVQSKDEAEAFNIALQISDYFNEAGRKELEDNDIIVADVGDITPRDNLLTIEYEYRKGLDVTIRLNNVISETATEVIEKTTINGKY